MQPSARRSTQPLGGSVGAFVNKLLLHAVRVMFAAGAMLLIGAVAGKVTGWLSTIVGIQSGIAVLVGFPLVAIAGIAGGTYVSIRHITPNSVFHPILAGALLGLFPVGVTFSGDAGLMRIAIVLTTVAIAAISAVVIRSRLAPPNTSLERARER